MEAKETKRLPSTFGIRFGVLNPTIAKQIKAQGLKYDPKKASEFEGIRDALHTLHFGGMIIDSQLKKMDIKLYNKILRHVGAKNKCNIKPLK